MKDTGGEQIVQLPCSLLHINQNLQQFSRLVQSVYKSQAVYTATHLLSKQTLKRDQTS